MVGVALLLVALTSCKGARSGSGSVLRDEPRVGLSAEALVSTVQPLVTFGQPIVISDATENAWGVYAGDVDIDGDTDVISVSLSAATGTIAWHENLLGDGTSWTTEAISADTNLFPRSVYGADLDGDGDLDAFAATQSFAAFYENTASSSWIRHTMPQGSSFSTGSSAFAADVDGDGDIDTLVSSLNDDTIRWYENLAGDGSSWARRIVSTTCDKPESVYAADIDTDGDIDVVSASSDDDKIAWHENTAGDGSVWAEHALTTSLGAEAVVAANFDGDGDIDVMATGFSTLFLENQSGDGSVWTEHQLPIPDGMPSGFMSFFVAADLDRDGDMDLVAAHFSFHKVWWYENVAGDGSAWVARLVGSVPTPRTVQVADMDGDGDVDVVASSSSGDQVVWWQTAFCGDGRVEGGEACDDGNRIDGDCCSSDCTFEALDSPCAADDDVCTDDRCDGAGLCAFSANVVCLPEQPPCEAGERCDPQGGCTPEVDAPQGTSCEADGDQCTRDVCDGNGTCAFADNVTPCCGDGQCEIVEGCGTCPADCGVCSGPCGNGVCAPDESCISCGIDCGPCSAACGDATCGAGEDCVACPLDCGSCPPLCGDGTCAASENCSSCPADCGGCSPGCGNGKCGSSETCSTCPGDCGSCPAQCRDGSCQPGEDCASCPADCGFCHSSCGDQTCSSGEHCVNCPTDCGPCPAVCGDGACHPGEETCSTCSADCGACPPGCGNGNCTGQETCASCPDDCGFCP